MRNLPDGGIQQVPIDMVAYPARMRTSIPTRTRHLPAADGSATASEVRESSRQRERSPAGEAVSRQGEGVQAWRSLLHMPSPERRVAGPAIEDAGNASGWAVCCLPGQLACVLMRLLTTPAPESAAREHDRPLRTVQAAGVVGIGDLEKVSP